MTTTFAGSVRPTMEDKPRDPTEVYLNTLEKMSKSMEVPKMTDEHVWLSIYCAATNALGTSGEDATNRADRGLTRFKVRFR